MHVALRQFWDGPPERLPDGFQLTKPQGNHTLTAICEVWTHQFGWETRLMIDGHDLQISHVVRSTGEMVETIEKWKAAMLEKGWR